MRTVDVAAPTNPSLRSVLDLDPYLAEGLSDEERRLARQVFTGHLLTVPPGRWELQRESPSLGYLIVDGVVCRETALVDHRSLELLGGGDVIRAAEEIVWPQLGGGAIITAITETEAIALGPGFIRGAARWPSVLVAVHRRLDAQRARLAMQGLIAHLPRADHRLLMVLWHLASRWGRVTPEGVLIPLQLTHDLLGQLIAARRSTVTLAVRNGERQGWLLRRVDGPWVLTRAGQATIETLTQTEAIRSNGETLMLRQRSGELLRSQRALRSRAARLERASRAEPSPIRAS